MSRTFRTVPTYVASNHIIAHNVNLRAKVAKRAGVTMDDVNDFFETFVHSSDNVITQATRGLISDHYRHGLLPLYNVSDKSGAVYTGRRARRFVKTKSHRMDRHNGRRQVRQELRTYQDTIAADLCELQEIDEYYADIDAAYYDSLFAGDAFYEDDYPDTDYHDQVMDNGYDPYFDEVYYDPVWDY